MEKQLPKRICLLFCHRNQSDRERLSGALRYAASRPDWDVRVIDRSSPIFEIEAAKLKQDWRPDGVIYTASPSFRKAIRLIGAQRAFKAELDPPARNGDPRADISVTADARQIMSEAVALLRRRGHNNFGFYGTELLGEKPYSELCERHFRKALGEKGQNLHVFHESAADSWSKRIQLASDWIKTLPLPCAIMSYSDELSRNLLNACHAAHISIPDQVAILGIDDSPEICETCRPTLSSLRIDFELAGYLAAEALDAAMRTGTHARQRKITYGINTISERMSTQDLHGCRRIVSAATELIRTMPLETLTVSVLVERLRVSRRLLEINFKKVLGQGIHAQILQRRLSVLRDRIVKTRIPIDELAINCGFRTTAAARIAFRKRYGTSPSGLRGHASQESTPGN